LELLISQIQARSAENPLRVLLVFGNPLGNFVGDTVIATQHVRFLKSVAPQTEISVWTGDPDVWRYLCPDILTVSIPPLMELDHGYDLIFF